MSPRGAYIPLHQYPTPSLAHSRLFTSDFDTSHRSGFRLPRPSIRSIAISLVTAVFLIILFYPRKHLTWLQQALRAEGIDYQLGFNQLYLTAKQGWREYEPPPIGWNEPIGTRTTWVGSLSDTCVEELVAQGRICEEWPQDQSQSKVGAIWTYANGSDPLLSVWRAEVTAMLAGEISAGVTTIRAAKRARHFREHDELRYSIRSVLDSFAPDSLAQLFILTTDLPANTLLRDTIDPPPPPVDEDAGKKEASPPLVDSTRIGQIPSWLSTSAPPSLSIVHHSSFFANRSYLPTFNSLSIESQFPYLRNIESEYFLYLNDDTLLLGKDSVVATDIGSPVIGSVFRLQTDLAVDSAAPDQAVGGPEGEWASLRRANWLLDQRFGRRERNYLAHIPKVMSMPILREIGEIWKNELDQTASSRFRGRQVEYQLPFLATHFTIESHRLALLRSFIAGRADRDNDGMLSLDERRQMLHELGFKEELKGKLSTESTVHAPYRSTRDDLPSLLSQAGLEAPRSTSLRCSSMDGYCPFRGEETDRNKFVRPVRYSEEEDLEDPPSPYCKIKLDECFGDSFLDSEEVRTSAALQRIAVDRTECGDCIIVRLVSTSGTAGLSAFLPRDDPLSASPDDSLEPRQEESNGSTSHTRRQQAMREILRYSYILGDSKSRFHGMRIPKDTDRVLKAVTEPDNDNDRNITWLTLNDDFANDHLSEMAQPILEDFFKRTWPYPSPYEA